VLSFSAADADTKEAAVAARVARARELRAAGWTLKRIARELDVCVYTVHLYLTN
jgi:DNA-binding NarL/FixJ family response regulator